MAAKTRVVIVGGGVLGTMHAVEARRRGFEVVQLERETETRGASVRNFGLAAATSAFMPPPAETEAAVAQLAPLLELLPVLPLLEPEELQPTVSSRLPATAAAAAIACLALKISLPSHSPRRRGPRCRSWLDKSE